MGWAWRWMENKDVVNDRGVTRILRMYLVSRIAQVGAINKVCLDK
jgi:hypothetical protein